MFQVLVQQPSKRFQTMMRKHVNSHKNMTSNHSNDKNIGKALWVIIAKWRCACRDRFTQPFIFNEFFHWQQYRVSVIRPPLPWLPVTLAWGPTSPSVRSSCMSVRRTPCFWLPTPPRPPLSVYCQGTGQRSTALAPVSGFVSSSRKKF